MKKAREGVNALDDLKVDVDEQQKDMIEENFDDTKLFPVLEEAWQLYMKLEDIKAQERKKVQSLIEQRNKMKAKYKSFKEMDPVQGMDLENGDEKGKQHMIKEKFLFKTIMCPFDEECPEFKKTCKRFPDSQYPAVTKMGVLCPYAHEINELCFPAEFKARIDALTKQIKQASKNDKS